MDACAKALIDIHEIPAASVLLIRMSMTAVIAAAFMYKTGIPDPLLGPKDTRMWLVARGIFGQLVLSFARARNLLNGGIRPNSRKFRNFMLIYEI